MKDLSIQDLLTVYEGVNTLMREYSQEIDYDAKVEGYNSVLMRKPDVARKMTEFANYKKQIAQEIEERISNIFK